MLKRSFNAMGGTAFLCLLGVLFCLWVHLGSGQEICFTAGCSLYEQSSLAGLSLWWIGMAAFAVLGVLALLGRVFWGYVLSWLGILADSCLLLLLLLTAPCFNCLVVALILMLVFLSFRRGMKESRSWGSTRQGRPILVCLWTLFFVCNIGVVVKNALPLWALSDNAEEASVRMFFSPSCSACKQAVEQLSGKIDVAFYPVAENEWDIAKVAHMKQSLDSGMNMYEAFTAASTVQRPSSMDLLSPGMLALRFRLLRNMAHVFMSGSRVVPFLEYRGLPSFLAKPARKRPQAPPQAAPASPIPPQSSPARPLRSSGGDPTLPIDTSISGACYSNEPCEDPEPFSRSPR